MGYNKKNIGIGIGVFVVMLTVWQTWRKLTPEFDRLKVQKGDFETTVKVMGALKAQDVIEITVPEVSFNEEVDIWAMQIMSIVDEGQKVKKGDEVALLDPKDVEEQLIMVNNKIFEYNSALEDAKIDSSLTLSDKRDAIQKAKDAVLDAEIKVEQSTFESKAIQRQSQIAYEKALRMLAQSKRELLTESQKNKTRITRIINGRKRYLRKLSLLEQLRGELSIKAPKDGMVVYGQGYDRQKIKVGSQVGRYMPLIATIPDLSTMQSEIFVKEIDIAKVSVGQEVKVKVDAFPKKEFTGQIISIANIGQDIPGEYQKGFKALVRLDDCEEQLLPGMTSENIIITTHAEDVLLVEKDAVYNDDGKSYVLHKKGLGVVKQEVIVSQMNETHCLVLSGLHEGDKVLINYLGNKADLPLNHLQN